MANEIFLKKVIPLIMFVESLPNTRHQKTNKFHKQIKNINKTNIEGSICFISPMIPITKDETYSIEFSQFGF
jgi:hypothetical protein